MKKTIYCRTVAKGRQAFYVALGSKSYFLFEQKYYVGVRDYFVGGKDINELSAACKNVNTAVRRTANKLPSYLQYVEKEFGVVLFDKRDKHKSTTYKRGKSDGRWAYDKAEVYDFDDCLDYAC